MGWIRTPNLPQHCPICRPAALLCRSFYFCRRAIRPVDSLSRSAAIGTL